LEAAVSENLGDSDALVMAAAPADYRPRTASEEKLPRTDGSLKIELEPTQDILTATASKRREGAVVVGFALESEDGVNRAKAKLERKQLDLVVLNMAREPGSGFETDTNRVTLISKEHVQELPQLPKREVAEFLLDRVEALL
jgi:phosphopantothenoylcysteine decarboxylase/phosphopantothenate--cysteine ligase